MSYDEHLITQAGGDGDPLDAIQRRVDSATPGPWFQHQDWIDMGVPDASHTISSDPKPYGKFIASVGLHYDVKHGNANLVAHAPEDLAHLLALVRAQQATLAAVLNLANTSGRCGWRISADDLRRTLRGES